MEDGEVNSTGAGQGDPAAAAPPDLVGLAHRLAANQTVGSNARRGGRRTAEEEAAAYLERNGLRAVPLDATGDPGEPQVEPLGGPAPVAPTHVVTPEFVRTCMETLLKGWEAHRQRSVFLKVARLTESKGYAEKLSAEAAAPPGAIEVMSLCAAECSQKYDLLASCAPEALLCVAALTWLAKDLSLHKRLNELERMKREAEQQPAAKPPETK
jgi:hypothetical protein